MRTIASQNLVIAFINVIARGPNQATLATVLCHPVNTFTPQTYRSGNSTTLTACETAGVSSLLSQTRVHEGANPPTAPLQSHFTILNQTLASSSLESDLESLAVFGDTTTLSDKVWTTALPIFRTRDSHARALFDTTELRGLPQSRNLMRHLLLAICFVGAAAVPSGAQVISQPDCASAAAYVTGLALPSAGDTTSNAWAILSLCGGTGETAAVQALQTYAVVSEPDSARVQLFMAMFSQRRTSAFFNAFQGVILNSQASDYFRRQAIRAYGAMYLEGTDFSSLNSTASNLSVCSLKMNTNSEAGAVSNLPSGFLNQMIATMISAASNAANSAAARGQANCWAIRLQFDVPPVASKIQLQYVCGNTFKITNTNTADVIVHADVIPPTARQKIEQQFNTVHGGGGIWMLQTDMKGSVRLRFNNINGQTAVNGGTVCH